jgi:hypothetical protein
MTPLSVHDAVMLRLRLINDAQERGATWAELARALGYPSAKAAKNDVKKTARHLERQLRARAEGVNGGHQ